MTLSEISVKRPVFITMVTMAIMVLGVVGYQRLNTELYPDVSFPIVTVTTLYPGASPSDIESQVSKKIEDAVVSVGGIEALFSQSYDGYSVVIARFELSADLQKVSNEMKEKVETIRPFLPDEVKAPVVSRLDLGALPVLTYAASSPLPIDLTRQVAQDVIKSSLERIDGVAEVRILGGLEREINVLLDQAALKSLSLSPLAVAEQLKAANLNIPGGQLAQGAREFAVRTSTQFESIEDIKGLIVATDQRGGRVRLDQIADVVDGHKDVRTMVRAGGLPAVSLEIVKQTGANTIKVADQVKARLAQLSQSELPKDYRLTMLIDQSVDIKANAHEVSIALWFGGAMAILVILLFMMDVRSTLISAVALPTSVVGTFFLMYMLGFTLNMMTLLALSLAIGLLIDDAVVVRENIFKYLERGMNPREAAIEGTKEVQLAVIATTLTIVAVFVPVAFMKGIVGQFFKQFGLTVTAAVLLSLWVAFTLDPMLSSRFSKPFDPAHHHEAAWTKPLRAFFTGLDRFYSSLLAWVLVHRIKTFVMAILVFALGVYVSGLMGSEFLTPEDRAQAIVNIEFPTGQSLEESSRRSLTLESKILKLNEVKALYTLVGPQEESNKVKWRVLYSNKEQRRETIETLKSQLRTLLAQELPGVKVNVVNPPNIEGVSGDFSPIMLHVTGPDLQKLESLNRAMQSHIAQVPGVAEVTSSLRDSKMDYRVVIDRAALAYRSLPAAVIGMAVRAAVNGQEAGYLRKQKPRAQIPGAQVVSKTNDVPIRVRLKASDRDNAAKLEQLVLPGPELMTLSDVAHIEQSPAPSVIEHFGRERKFTLYVTPSGRSLVEVMDDIQKYLDSAAFQRELGGAYRIELDGDIKSQKESAQNLGVALLLAVVFIYLVLAAQFESFKHPFTIMLSLPLAFVGAWMALFLSGYSQSISSNIGIILLMGLVTKNAILLIDAALNEMRDHGHSASDAVYLAGQKRLRPIVMTSAAMILGMLPTAFSSGVGSEFRGPMAIAVIGGVISSTLLTLVVVPVVFVWFEKLTRRQVAKTSAS